MCSRMFSCVVLVLALANCAAFNRKNTPLVALVEERLVPEKMPAKVLTAPLYIPVGMVGGILDVFLVHPVMEMPRAWDDMVDLFWTGDAGYVTAMGSLPVRTALSPVWFTLDVFVRSALDFNRNEPPAPPDSGLTLDQLVAEGDAAKIELYLQTHEIKVTDNTALRKICEMKTGPDLHATVLNHLGSELLFAQNEQYLIARLGILPEGGPRDMKGPSTMQ